MAVVLVVLLTLAGCRRESQETTVAIAGGDASDGDGSWEAFHEFGRWALAGDRQMIQIERSTVRSRCADHRVVVADDSASRWLLRFETRITAEHCPAGGCVGCSLQLGLELPRPSRRRGPGSV